MVYYIELIFLDESSFRLQAGRNCSRFQKSYSRCRFMTHMRKNFTDGPIKRPAYKNTHISSPLFISLPSSLSPSHSGITPSSLLSLFFSPRSPTTSCLLPLPLPVYPLSPTPPISSDSPSHSTHSGWRSWMTVMTVSAVASGVPLSGLGQQLEWRRRCRE